MLPAKVLIVVVAAKDKNKGQVEICRLGLKVAKLLCTEDCLN